MEVKTIPEQDFGGVRISVLYLGKRNGKTLMLILKKKIIALVDRDEQCKLTNYSQACFSQTCL